jgi:hypothetical protein
VSISKSRSKASKSSSTPVTSAAAHADASATRIASATALASPTTPAAGSLIFVTLPPATANIPTPPPGFVATNGTDYRGLLPRKTEIAVLSNAVSELQRFTEFTQVFGQTVPPLASVQQIFDAAEQWSTMRNASTDWDLFCRTQEGLSWKVARALIAKMKPAFALASSSNDALAVQNPSLNALFGAASVIAQRGAVSRAANKQAKAEGKPPTHGKANKKAAKLASAVAAAMAKATPAPVAAVATATVSPPPATVVAPAAAVATPATSAPAPVATEAPTGLVVNPALNAAAH